eukprot:scaffold91114_cov64-Phaeocystis_antarctica.AAC.1
MRLVLAIRAPPRYDPRGRLRRVLLPFGEPSKIRHHGTALLERLGAHRSQHSHRAAYVHTSDVQTGWPSKAGVSGPAIAQRSRLRSRRVAPAADPPRRLQRL